MLQRAYDLFSTGVPRVFLCRSKDPVEFVQRLLDERDKYDKIIQRAFANEKTFQNTLNSAFEHFMNLNPRSPEFISLFVDDKLRKGLKGVSEDEVEAMLDKVMTLFRYLQEKDVFEKYYKMHLSKRLLNKDKRSVSDDAERSMLVKLKTECGYQFTSKLESMFTDVKTSEDTMQAFQQVRPSPPSYSTCPGFPSPLVLGDGSSIKMWLAYLLHRTLLPLLLEALLYAWKSCTQWGQEKIREDTC